MVDMLLGVAEDVLQQLARDIVAHRLAIGDGLLQQAMRGDLDLQVAVQGFDGGLADVELAQVLQVRQALDRQDALDQAIGVLHLLDRLLVLMLGQLLEAPVLQHARMQEVLVDRGQLVLQLRVQIFQNLGIALHLLLLAGGIAGHCARGLP